MSDPDPSSPPLARLLTASALGAGSFHELRNSLASVASSLYLARRDRSDESRLLKHLEKASAELARAQSSAEAVLALARGEPLSLEPCSLAALLASARALVSFPSQLVFSEHVDPPELRVEAHPVLFPQALSNLYLNAIEAQRQQPRSALRVLACVDPQGHAVLRVEDDGPGIPEAQRASLFDPLVTHKSTGTGLGLAVARAITEAHRGALTIEDSPAGACFQIRLPGASLHGANQAPVPILKHI